VLNIQFRGLQEGLVQVPGQVPRRVQELAQPSLGKTVGKALVRKLQNQFAVFFANLRVFYNPGHGLGEIRVSKRCAAHDIFTLAKGYFIDSCQIWHDSANNFDAPRQRLGPCPGRLDTG